MSNWWENDKGRDHGALWLGVVLIVAGVLFLVGQQMNINWGEHSWPYFVIVPGLVLFVLGLGFGDEAGLGMTIPGGIIATVGLLLLYQSTYDAYASWAYAWALVAPGSVGVSLVTYGLLHRNWELVDGGLQTAAVGLGLFIGFGLFFENVIGIGENGSTNAMRSLLPVLAVVLGAIIVLLSLVPHRSGPESKPADGQGGQGGEPPAV